MKKILKKTGAALLGFTLALSALTGCGAKQDTSSDAKKDDADSVVYRTVDEIKESGTINENPGYTVGIPSLGSADTIAPAVTKENESLLNWLNDELVSLGSENFFHVDYEATLLDTYGADYEETLVVEPKADK